jgi:hypothetical protein
LKWGLLFDERRRSDYYKVGEKESIAYFPERERDRKWKSR